MEREKKKKTRTQNIACFYQFAMSFRLTYCVGTSFVYATFANVYLQRYGYANTQMKRNAAKRHYNHFYLQTLA